MPIYYTVYKITNKINGKIYIGLHKTSNLDDGYMGSGKALRIHQKKFGMKNFTKEILFVFDNPEEMIAKEEELVTEEFVARPDTYNRMKGGIGGWGATIGTVSVKDSNGNRFRVAMDDPRYLSGELVGTSKGTLLVKDKNGNHLRVEINDPRYLSGELNHNLKGNCPSKSTKNKISKALKMFYKDEEKTKNRISDFKETEKRRGYISELSRKWGISSAGVIKFLKSENLYNT